MEEVINLLKNSDLKFVENRTGIPYARMYKWIKGKARPKTDDFEKLKIFFEINGKSSIEEPSSRGKPPPLLHAPPMATYRASNSIAVELSIDEWRAIIHDVDSKTLSNKIATLVNDQIEKKKQG